MTIRVQIGEEEDGIRQWAEYGEHRTAVATRGDAALRLARILIKAGLDPNEPYETARGDKVAMRFPTLRFAASLIVSEPTAGGRPRLVKWTPNPNARDDDA